MIKTYLLLFSLFIVSVPTYSQLKVNSQGKVSLENELKLFDGKERGLSFGDSHKMYSHDFQTYFLAYDGGFRMNGQGKMKMMSADGGTGLLEDSVTYTFDSPYIHVDPWFYEPTLLIRSKGSRPLHTSLYSDYPGSPREGIRSDVSRSSDKAFVAYLSDNRYSGLVFSVNGEGLVYGSAGFTQTSDVRLKENIKTLTSASELLNSLRGVSFNYKKTAKVLAVSDNTDIGPCISNEVKEQIQTEQRLGRIGLVAQEVEAVIPEVVRTLPDGTKTIMYTDLIPLLIENIKVLNRSLEEQNEKILQFENLLNNDSDNKKQSPKSAIQKKNVALYQNTPNPFNQETEIKYQVPSDASASICIYNLSGQQLKKYPLTDTNGKIVVSASEFVAGIYIYSLIVNNQEVDSKRMVLTD